MTKYKCRICGTANVSDPNGVCFKCSKMSDSSQYDDFGRAIPTQSSNAKSAPTFGGSSYKAPQFGYDDFGRPIADTAKSGVSQSPTQGSINPFTSSPGGMAETAFNNQTACRNTRRVNESGTISNYRETDKVSPAFLRWIIGMFTWSPLCVGKEKRSFMLYAADGSCYGVEMSGRVMTGSLYDNVDVRVIGRRKANGTISATSIVVNTTGEEIRPVMRISPWVMWLVTLALITAVVLLARELSSLSNLDSFFISLLGIIVLVIAGIVFIVSLFGRRRRRGAGIARAVLGIGIVICLILLFTYPQLIIMVAGLAIMIYLLIRIITPG